MITIPKLMSLTVWLAVFTLISLQREFFLMTKYHELHFCRFEDASNTFELITKMYVAYQWYAKRRLWCVKVKENALLTCNSDLSTDSILKLLFAVVIQDMQICSYLERISYRIRSTSVIDTFIDFIWLFSLIWLNEYLSSAFYLLYLGLEFFLGAICESFFFYNFNNH